MGTQSATGSALTNLFADFPPDHLAQLHTEGFPADEGSGVPRMLRVDSVSSRLRDAGPVVQRVVQRVDQWPAMHRVMRYDRVRQFIKAFDPQIIYFRPVDEPRLYWTLPQRLASDLGLPMVTHIMDDWPGRLVGQVRRLRGRRRAAGERLRRAMNAGLIEQFRLAHTNLSICAAMSRGFGRRYGVDFIPFANAIDRDEWTGITRRRRFADDGTFRIVYTGGLAADMTLAGVCDLAEATARLHAAGVPVTFTVYGQTWYARTFRQHIGDRPGVRYGGCLPREEYLQTLADADVLALPINFDAASLRYIRYSMSNKAPEYMAAGAPILAYGPIRSATIAYAHDAGWAHTLTRPGVEGLTRELLRLFHAPALRESLAAKAKSHGLIRHDATRNRTRFNAILADAAR